MSSSDGVKATTPTARDVLLLWEKPGAFDAIPLIGSSPKPAGLFP
jgi:hypothetical protein